MTGLPLDLGAPTPKAAKPKRAPKRAPKPEADPPPFTASQALGAIASAAGGRFAPGVESEWEGGHLIAIRKHVRKFPKLETWALVGEWLRAGGDPYAKTHGPKWAAGSAFANAVTVARQWDANGRGLVDAKFGASVPARRTQDLPPPPPREERPEVPRMTPEEIARVRPQFYRDRLAAAAGGTDHE